MIKKNQGFTLIEILVVITIIALLTSAGLVSYSAFLKKSRDERRKLDLNNIRSALEMYRSDNDYYPSTSLTELTPNYIPQVPQDPGGENSYGYEALPDNCDNSTTYCTDYIVGAKIEDITQATSCTGMPANSCGTTNCNYCLGPYGEK